MAAARELRLHHTQGLVPTCLHSPRRIVGATTTTPLPRRHRCDKLYVLSSRKTPSIIRSRAAAGDGNGTYQEEDGVVLGTMKLPVNTDVPRFETLLFQWANSLSQGASVPLLVPLKVDRVKGGARLGFSRMADDGTAEVPVYIDCLVFPAEEEEGARKEVPGVPMFRAIRNGPQKGKAAPGEPNIMRSLLQALQTSVEIAKL